MNSCRWVERKRKARLGEQHRFRRLFSCGSLAVGGIELAHVARHALCDLLQAALYLALHEVVVAAVIVDPRGHARARCSRHKGMSRVLLNF